MPLLPNRIVNFHLTTRTHSDLFGSQIVTQQLTHNAQNEQICSICSITSWPILIAQWELIEIHRYRIVEYRTLRHLLPSYFACSFFFSSSYFHTHWIVIYSTIVLFVCSTHYRPQNDRNNFFQYCLEINLINYYYHYSY